MLLMLNNDNWFCVLALPNMIIPSLWVLWLSCQLFLAFLWRNDSVALFQNRKHYFLDTIKTICWKTFWKKNKKLKCAWLAQLIRIPVYQSCLSVVWNNRELKPHCCFKSCCRWWSGFTCISISRTEDFLLSLRKF